MGGKQAHRRVNENRAHLPTREVESCKAKHNMQEVATGCVSRLTRACLWSLKLTLEIHFVPCAGRLMSGSAGIARE